MDERMRSLPSQRQTWLSTIDHFPLCFRLVAILLPLSLPVASTVSRLSVPSLLSFNRTSCLRANTIASPRSIKRNTTIAKLRPISEKGMCYSPCFHRCGHPAYWILTNPHGCSCRTYNRSATPIELRRCGNCSGKYDGAARAKADAEAKQRAIDRETAANTMRNRGKKSKSHGAKRESRRSRH